MVQIPEVPIHPGDIVIGDLDGVVVVPANRVEEVAALAVKQRERENDRETAFATANRSSREEPPLG